MMQTSSEAAHMEKVQKTPMDKGFFGGDKALKTTSIKKYFEDDKLGQKYWLSNKAEFEDICLHCRLHQHCCC
jgi:hypothetical protein